MPEPNPSPEQSDREFCEAMLRRHAEALSEHFDAVQIFVANHNPAELDGTASINYGIGNWYTRYGQVREWVIMQEEQARIKARKDNE